MMVLRPVIDVYQRDDARIRTILRQAIARQLELRVPVVVLAETLPGGPCNAPVNWVLEAVGTAPTAPATGRDAGKLLGRTGGTNTAEALAVPGSTILTSDPDDLQELLTSHHGVDVRAI